MAVAAEEMLKSLTGSDAVFYEAEATRGTELVRLRGVANLAGEVAQAQFTLRGALAGGGLGTSGAVGLASPRSPVCRTHDTTGVTFRVDHVTVDMDAGARRTSDLRFLQGLARPDRVRPPGHVDCYRP